MGLRDKLRAICHEVRMRPLQGDPTQIGQLRIRIDRLPSPEAILTQPEPELKQLRALLDRLIYDLDRFESNRSIPEAQRYQHRTGLPPHRRPLVANWYQLAMLKEANGLNNPGAEARRQLHPDWNFEMLANGVFRASFQEKPILDYTLTKTGNGKYDGGIKEVQVYGRNYLPLIDQGIRAPLTIEFFSRAQDLLGEGWQLEHPWWRKAQAQNESDEAWQQRLKDEAFAKGTHIPHSWSTEYDDGADGCMPTGWYLTGLDTNGLPIVFPVRHEYGPFKSNEEALAFRDKAQQLILKKVAMSRKASSDFSEYQTGNQPCQDFKPSDIDKEWFGQARHQCPKCEGRRLFCDNCHTDHHENGWESCEKLPTLVFHKGKYWQVSQSTGDEYLLEPLRDDGTGLRVEKSKCRVVVEPELSRQLEAIKRFISEV